MWLKIDQPAHEQTDGSELVAFELTDWHSTALCVLCILCTTLCILCGPLTIVNGQS